MVIFVKNESSNIFGINNLGLEKSTVYPMSVEQISLCSEVNIRRKQCFDNCYNVVSKYPEQFSYVLCVSSLGGFHFEHAIIRDLESKKLVDPTLSIALNDNEESEVIVIKEFDYSELCEFVLAQKKESFPPDFSSMSKLGYLKDVFVTMTQYMREKQKPEFEMVL